MYLYSDNYVTGKIGYGTVSETLACKTPLVFVRRDHFNEEPFLRKMLEVKSAFEHEVLCSGLIQNVAKAYLNIGTCLK